MRGADQRQERLVVQRLTADEEHALDALAAVLEQVAFVDGCAGVVPTRRNMPLLAHQFRQASRANTLVRLLLLGLDVPTPETVAAVGSDTLDRLERVGFVTVSGSACRSTLRVSSFEGQVACSDFIYVKRLGHDCVYTPANDSRHLARATVRSGISTALDLCTGSGIQATLASRHAARVTAVDLNPRAARLAMMTARLNDARNVDVYCGDLYQPVGDQRFDLVTANPPFVATTHSSRAYRDGGPRGDATLNRLLDGLRVHLAPAGLAQIVTVLYEWKDGGQLNVLRDFAEERGVDLFVLLSPPRDAAALAMSQYQETVFDFQEYDSRIRAYLEELEREGLVWWRLAVLSLRPADSWRFDTAEILERYVHLDTSASQAVARHFGIVAERGA